MDIWQEQAWWQKYVTMTDFLIVSYFSQTFFVAEFWFTFPFSNFTITLGTLKVQVHYFVTEFLIRIFISQTKFTTRHSVTWMNFYVFLFETEKLFVPIRVATDVYDYLGKNVFELLDFSSVLVLALLWFGSKHSNAC